MNSALSRFSSDSEARSGGPGGRQLLRFVEQTDEPKLARDWPATRSSPRSDGSAQVAVVYETHLAEYGDESPRRRIGFSKTVDTSLEGLRFPTTSGQPCLNHLQSIGMEMLVTHDVTKYAGAARDKEGASRVCGANSWQLLSV